MFKQGIPWCTKNHPVIYVKIGKRFVKHLIVKLSFSLKIKAELHSFVWYYAIYVF